MTRHNYVVAAAFGIFASPFITLGGIQGASADQIYCQNVWPPTNCFVIEDTPPQNSGGVGGGSEVPVKSMKKVPIPTKSMSKVPKTPEAPPPDLSQVVQQCGFVHLAYVQGQGGSGGRIPYQCAPPTVAQCGNFDRETQLAECCCVAPN